MAASSTNANALESLLANNSQLGDIYNTLKTANGNYEAVYYNVAKQRGCSEEEAKIFLSQLQQMWSSL